MNGFLEGLSRVLMGPFALFAPRDYETEAQKWLNKKLFENKTSLSSLGLADFPMWQYSYPVDKSQKAHPPHDKEDFSGNPDAEVVSLKKYKEAHKG